VRDSSSITTRVGKVRARGRRKNRSAEENAADRSLRETGIRVIGNIPWGAHICIFYETKEDLLDAATAYFAAGLKSNELCLWAISDPITETDAKETLSLAVPDLDRHLAVGQIEMLQGTEWYLKGDQFNLRRITGSWSEKLQGALAKGYDGMRVSGNAFWIETNLWKAFCEYEEELDRTLAGQKMIAMCTYSLQKSRGVDVLEVARAHQCSIARRKGVGSSWKLPSSGRPSRKSKSWRVRSTSYRNHSQVTRR
jgi:DcmR-like sensory protein